MKAPGRPDDLPALRRLPAYKHGRKANRQGVPRTTRIRDAAERAAWLLGWDEQQLGRNYGYVGRR